MMNKTGFARTLTWSTAVLSLTLTVAGLAAGIMPPFLIDGELSLPPHLWFSPLSTVTFALVGALVAVRYPRNPIGWICGGVGILTGLTLGAFGYHMAGQSGALMLPGTEIARWLDTWLWIPATILPITFLLLLFPDGHLPSARWWPIGWAAGLGIAAYMLSVALHPSPPIEPNPLPNPFGIPGAAGTLNLLALVANLLVALGAVGSLAALVVRFRRARGVERLQLKWLTYAGVLTLVGNVVVYAWYATRPDDLLAFEVLLISTTAALTTIALATGLAILRYRLYDIDLIINRTLVYGALTVGVAASYAVVVGAVGALFQARNNFLVSLLATGLVALAFQPLRDRLQRGVNRLMYGDRDDPYKVLSRLGERVQATLVPEAVLLAVVETIAQALKLPYVAITLGQGDGSTLAAEYGVKTTSGRPRTGEAEDLVIPLVYQGETRGALILAPSASGMAFTSKDRRLLEDIARQAGVAAHAVRLTQDLQRSRELLVKSREEERRRLRRDLHDELGPRLASLKLNLDVARNLVSRDPRAAEALLLELRAQAQAAIADIRRLAYDLRPPALDEFGLKGAIQEYARQLERRDGLSVRLDAPISLPPLPAAVEVAAYRITLEALANAVRHSQGRNCCVAISLIDKALQVEVRDDGRGLSKDVLPGVGLSSMRERAAELGGTSAIEALPHGGTRVLARLPLH